MPFHLPASTAINKNHLYLTHTLSKPKYNASGSQWFENIILLPSKAIEDTWKTFVFNGLQHSHLVLHFAEDPTLKEPHLSTSAM